MSTAQDMRDFGQNFLNAANELEAALKRAVHAENDLESLRRVNALHRENYRKVREVVRVYEILHVNSGLPVLSRLAGF